MTKLDEETLIAYADCQLDPQRMAEVEAALAYDPEAQATVRLFRDSATVLRSTFDPILHELAPKRLLDAINAPVTATVQDIRLARRGGVARFLPQTVWARAAVVALLVGGGAGYLGAQWGHLAMDAPVPLAITDSLLQEALETTASGAVFTRYERSQGIERNIMPLLTFRDAENHYCREFESTLKGKGAPRINYGVACREDGFWQPRALMAAPLIATTLGGIPTEHSEYSPAAGEAAGFDAVVRQLMVNDPLPADEEATLINRGWF